MSNRINGTEQNTLIDRLPWVYFSLHVVFMKTDSLSLPVIYFTLCSNSLIYKVIWVAHLKRCFCIVVLYYFLSVFLPFKGLVGNIKCNHKP